MDETRAPVLDPKAGKTKTGYLWAVTRDDRGWGGGDPPAVVFTYAPGRHGCHAMDILTGFEGILQVDGYTGYDALAEPKRVGGMPLTLAYCWAHSRRKLHDIYQKDGSEIAAEGLRRIAQIYKIEATVRGRSPEERLAARMLPRALGEAATAIGSGGVVDDVLARGIATLERAGFDVDYFELVDEALRPGKGGTRLVAAARIGTTRLIDNIAVAPQPERG
jgi:hypothetical protein